MPEDPKTAPKPTVQPALPESPAIEQDQDKEEEIGDFITRHVLEKDSVFFEG